MRILFILLFLFISCDSRQASIDRGREIFRKEMQKWSYHESIDKMRNTKTFYASIQSLNELQFDSPYSGGSYGILTIRKSPEFGKDIMFSIEKGQFLCHDECFVFMKFDDRKIEKYKAIEPSDGTPNILFLQPYKIIINKIQKAKHLIIEADFYQEGRQQVEFNISGLVWDYQ